MRAITLICTQLPSGYIHNDLQCMRRLNESERTIHIYIQRFFQQAIKLGYQVRIFFRNDKNEKKI